MSNIILKLDNKKLFPISSFTFAGGEEHIALKDVPMETSMGLPFIKCEQLEVIARLQSSQALVQLLLVTEVLNRIGNRHGMSLTIPYFPYARQDRVIVRAEPFSLECFATLLNIPIYDSIKVYDLHSPVLYNYIPKKLTEVKQLDIIKGHELLIDFIKKARPIVVAPDKGAFDKTVAIAKVFDLPFISAHKARDPKTGDIKRLELPAADIVKGQAVLIPDDICDGGRTFIKLAELLKKAGASVIALYVTHGIFSQGYEVFDGLIDVIYTTNTFIPKTPPKHGKLAVHNIIAGGE